MRSLHAPGPGGSAIASQASIQSTGKYISWRTKTEALALLQDGGLGHELWGWVF